MGAVAHLGGRQVGECQAWSEATSPTVPTGDARMDLPSIVGIGRWSGSPCTRIASRMRCCHEAMGFSVIETGSTYRKDGL